MNIDKLFELKLIKQIENNKSIIKKSVKKETFMGEYVAFLQQMKNTYKKQYIAFLNFKDFNIIFSSPTTFYGIMTFNIKLLNREVVLCPYDPENDKVDFKNMGLVTF